MSRAERMKAACDERYAATNGECESYDCYFLGWCDYCFEAAERKGKRVGDREHEPEDKDSAR